MENGQLLARIDERVQAILEKLDIGERRMNEHSRRLGALERWRSWLTGALVAISFVVGILARSVL